MPTFYGLKVDGGDFVTDNLTQPLDDLDTATQAARDLSLKPDDNDAVVAVVSRGGDTAEGYWQDAIAVFLDGKELERSDARYPS
jgi:hypothetical protein